MCIYYIYIYTCIYVHMRTYTRHTYIHLYTAYTQPTLCRIWPAKFPSRHGLASRPVQVNHKALHTRSLHGRRSTRSWEAELRRFILGLGKNQKHLPVVTCSHTMRQVSTLTRHWSQIFSLEHMSTPCQAILADAQKVCPRFPANFVSCQSCRGQSGTSTFLS